MNGNTMRGLLLSLAFWLAAGSAAAEDSLAALKIGRVETGTRGAVCAAGPRWLAGATG